MVPPTQINYKNHLHYNDVYHKNLPTNDAALPVGAHMRIFGFVKSSPSFAKMFIALYDIALIVKDFPFPDINYKNVFMLTFKV